MFTMISYKKVVQPFMSTIRQAPLSTRLEKCWKQSPKPSRKKVTRVVIGGPGSSFALLCFHAGGGGMSALTLGPGSLLPALTEHQVKHA